MNAGELRHVVRLERPVETRNATGEVEWSWETFAYPVRAAIEPTSGSKKWTAQQLSPEVTTVIRIRWRPYVTAKMRVVWIREVSGSPQLFEYFEVLAAVDPFERRTELHLHCVSRPAEGFRSYGS